MRNHPDFAVSSRRIYWSEKFQTLVFDGAEDPIAEQVEIFEAMTGVLLGHQTTSDEWQGD